MRCGRALCCSWSRSAQEHRRDRAHVLVAEQVREQLICALLDVVVEVLSAVLARAVAGMTSEWCSTRNWSASTTHCSGHAVPALYTAPASTRPRAPYCTKVLLGELGADELERGTCLPIAEVFE